MSMKFVDKSKSFLELVSQAADKASLSIGFNIACTAKETAQVSSGLLANSIRVTDGVSYYGTTKETTGRRTTPYNWSGYIPIGSPAEPPFPEDFIDTKLVTKEHEVVVGTNVWYAKFIEFVGGHRYFPATNTHGHDLKKYAKLPHDCSPEVRGNDGPMPFMTPAIAKEESRAICDIKKAMDDVVHNTPLKEEVIEYA